MCRSGDGKRNNLLGWPNICGAEIDLGTKEVFTIDHGTYAPSTEVEERV